MSAFVGLDASGAVEAAAAKGIAIYSTTLEPAHALYVPAGFLCAVKPLTPQCMGLRRSLLARAPRTAEHLSAGAASAAEAATVAAALDALRPGARLVSLPPLAPSAEGAALAAC